MLFGHGAVLLIKRPLKYLGLEVHMCFVCLVEIVACLLVPLLCRRLELFLATGALRAPVMRTMRLLASGGLCFNGARIRLQIGT